MGCGCLLDYWGSEPEQAEYRSGQAGPDLIMNTARVDAALPTIKYALEYGAKPFMLYAHLGRPNGKKKTRNSSGHQWPRRSKKRWQARANDKGVASSEVKATCANPSPVDRWLALP